MLSRSFLLSIRTCFETHTCFAGSLCKKIPGKYALGAVLGVDIKKKLTWQGIRQAECEFYLWGHYSQFPFIQVITDMQTRGVVYFSSRIDGESLQKCVAMTAAEEADKLTSSSAFALCRDCWREDCATEGPLRHEIAGAFSSTFQQKRPRRHRCRSVKWADKLSR